MGIGEVKQAFVPRHKRVRCARCGNEYDSVAMRQCNHPAVTECFGNVYICIYCCKRKPCPFYRAERFSGLCSCKLYIKKETANGG